MNQSKILFRNLQSTPLIRRALAFIAIFVMVSGIIGPPIISGGILYKYHFDIYGGLGKAALFGGAVLAILISRHKKQVELEAWRKTNLIWLGLAALSFFATHYSVNYLLHHHISGAYWPIMAHASLMATILFALGGCFGPASIRSLIRTYRRELLISIALAAGFYLLLLGVYGLWKILAAAVLHSVRWLLQISRLQAGILPPRTLVLDKFGIEVAQYCSGIESIALFSGLYIVIGVLDWQRFNHQRLLLIFPFALLVLFGLNILRVFGLVIAGYYINPNIAFSLFHTYAGMVFFIAYAGIFWGVSYRKLLSNVNLKN